MQSMKFEELVKKYAVPIKVPLKTKVKRRVKNTIKSMLRVIRGAESIKTMNNMDYSLYFMFDCQEKKDEGNTSII